MARTYEPIASQTLSTSAASVTFSDISSLWTDLVIAVMAQSTGTATLSGGTLRFNGDTGTNYSHTILYGTGSVAGSVRGANFNRIRYAGDIPTTNFETGRIHIMSYANTNVFKTILSDCSSAQSGSTVNRVVGLWRSTSAITSVTLFSNDDGADSFASGSTFSLYGIRAA